MDTQELFSFSQFVELSKAHKEVVEEICSTWRQVNDFSKYFEEGCLTIHDNKDGTILLGVGFSKYLICFEDAYVPRAGDNKNKDLVIRISFYKVVIDKITRKQTYQLLNDDYSYDLEGDLYEGEQRVTRKSFVHSYCYELFRIFGTLVMKDKNFIKE